VRTKDSASNNKSVKPLVFHRRNVIWVFLKWEVCLTFRPTKPTFHSLF